jgi:hypothetical protein
MTSKRRAADRSPVGPSQEQRAARCAVLSRQRVDLRPEALESDQKDGRVEVRHLAVIAQPPEVLAEEPTDRESVGRAPRLADLHAMPS